jgi:Flp pilus assembly protein TadD
VITSLSRSTRQNTLFTAALLSALVLAGTGCSTSNLLTYAQESRNKGLRQFQAGDYNGAAGSFRSASRQDPRDYKSFYYMGASYDQLGSHQQAAQAYQSSLKVMDVTLEGKADKAFRAKTIDGLAISIAKGQDRTAHLALPQPGARPAEDAWLRAKVARYTGDADAALEAYNEAALQDPNDFYIAKDHALYLTDLGQNDAATIQLRRAYRLNSKDQEVAAALTRVGTVPGPALKSKEQLAQPPIPRGPLPEWELPKIGGGNKQATTPADSAVAPSTPTVQAPRD